MSATATLIQLPKDETPKRSLVRKLSEVMAAVGWIEKTGYNEFHRYKYAQEADLVQALRGELAKRQIFIFPSVRKGERSQIEVETMKWDDKAKAKVPNIRKTQLTEIEVDWTFVDGESGEERTITVYGVGEDNVDKGFYKAFTGSEKYMLMKSFLIPTGDDPEKDSQEEAQDAKREGKATAKALGEAKAEKMKQKGTSRAMTLFYTLPERHNGNFAEFVNIQGFISDNQDKEDSLRMVFTAHGAKKTKDETAIVPAEKLDSLLQKLAGDCGVDVMQLKAAQ
jgi:hypothetical protein